MRLQRKATNTQVFGFVKDANARLVRLLDSKHNVRFNQYGAMTNLNNFILLWRYDHFYRLDCCFYLLMAYSYGLDLDDQYSSFYVQ